tara:strand:+ start:4285 stop:4443 length:159 start_codon:yes stop_codon:yes gene_type:complete
MSDNKDTIIFSWFDAEPLCNNAKNMVADNMVIQKRLFMDIAFLIPGMFLWKL